MYFCLSKQIQKSIRCATDVVFTCAHESPAKQSLYPIAWHAAISTVREKRRSTTVRCISHSVEMFEELT